MSKIMSRNASLYVWDSSGACQSVTSNVSTATLSSTVDTPDVTCWGDVDRVLAIGGLKDWTLDFDGFYESDASKIDGLFAGIQAGSTYFSFFPAGSTSASPVYSACAVCTKYDLKFGVGDAAGISVTMRNRSGSLTRANA